MRKTLLLIVPMLLAIGCATPSDVCEVSEDLRDNLKVALLADGGDQSVVAGATLLQYYEEVCP